MKKIILSTVAVATVTLALQAAEKDAKKDPDALVTHTELGYMQTDGNTKTKTFNLDSLLKKAWGKHHTSLELSGQYGSADDVENKKQYLIEGNYDYAFTKHFAFNYLIGYKSDIYSGFDYQAYTGPGAKYQAIKNDKQELSFTANILYNQDKYYPSEDTNSYSGYRAEGAYKLNVKKDLTFIQNLSIRGDFDESDNYFATSKTALISKISDIFSAGLSYKVNYVNTPVAGKKNKDTTLTANLIMDY
ncbi:hypothetical protein MNB_SM-5-765 [hydrothermal vent metagenome]|uniref:Uncharacterized protein n=1 Tax=hydrothermal vent metagenome TaxID=652676 RepID=A0A1W1CHY0_9ZZZZ